MTEEKDPDRYSNLRRRAEALIQERSKKGSWSSSEDIKQLIHELNVHQVELEMQNEDLRLAQERLEISRDRFANLYDFSPVGYFTLSEEGTILETNLRLAEMVGIERMKLIGKPFSSIVFKDDQDHYFLNRLRLFQLAGPYTFDLRLKKKSGEVLYTQLDCLPGYDHEVQDSVRRIAVTDINDRVRAENELRMTSAVFENTGEGIFITDAGGNIMIVNDAFINITGYHRNEIIGKNPRVLKSEHHSANFYHNLWQSLTMHGVWQGEVWNRRKNGEVYPQWTTISSVKDKQGQVINFISVFTDISAMKQAESRLHYLATHDALTNLPNRLLFQDRLSHALQKARRLNTHIAVMYLDIDHFKLINDTLGHVQGDHVLQMISTRLAGCIRESDTIARMGGDEFTVILEDIGSIPEVVQIVQKLLNVISQPIQVADLELTPTGSIGISLFPTDGDEPVILMGKADRAMYQAKETGRNNYQFYTFDLDAEAHERLSLSNSLHRALERDELYLLYQPLIELSSGKIMGVEALLRWRHPDKGELSASQVIPLAEETGIIAAISAWVLQTACKQNVRWQSKRKESRFRVAMNLSASQYQNQELLTIISRIVQETGLHPGSIILELTESMLIRYPERARNTLFELKALGVGLSIDDFGMGCSTLGNLSRLPFDTIKIDRSFLENIPNDLSSSSIVTALITMAHVLGIAVVAEGIENESQANFLLSKGCDFGQGFFFGRPVTAEEITNLL